jgi:carbamoyl-phosphate synthase small subunit
LSTEDTTIVRVPWNYDYSKELYDGLVVSGGPGDPTSCEKTVDILKKALVHKKPVFATGQGAVILAIASGASAFRMAQGHRGSSVPVINLENGRCYITAQNHGYGIREDSLAGGWYPTYLNNTDQSIEGFASQKGLLSAVLFQPEGNPGPADTAFLFSDFLSLVRNGGIHA